MNFKIIFCFFMFFGGSFLNAQIMDTVSYVPVKQGSYDKLSTKTNTELAKSSSGAALGTLKANSSTLVLDTTQVTFGKPVYVKGSVFTKGGASLKILGNLAIQSEGNAFVAATLSATKASKTESVSARDLALDRKDIKLSVSTPIDLEGIAISAPSCEVEWKAVDGYNLDGMLRQYNLFACKGGGGQACNATESDITRCKEAKLGMKKNTWDSANCCCKGSVLVLFQNARMCNDNALCSDGVVVSVDRVCNEYATDSAECICAKGNLKLCTPKVYGGSSPETRCVQSGEYHPECQCEYFVEFTNNYKNYACTGIPAKCMGGDGGKVCTPPQISEGGMCCCPKSNPSCLGTQCLTVS